MSHPCMDQEPLMRCNRVLFLYDNATIRFLPRMRPCLDEEYEAELLTIKRTSTNSRRNPEYSIILWYKGSTRVFSQSVTFADGRVCN